MGGGGGMRSWPSGEGEEGAGRVVAEEGREGAVAMAKVEPAVRLERVCTLRTPGEEGPKAETAPEALDFLPAGRRGGAGEGLGSKSST